MKMILIRDDHPINQELSIELLASYGFDGDRTSPLDLTSLRTVKHTWCA